MSRVPTNISLRFQERFRHQLATLRSLGRTDLRTILNTCPQRALTLWRQHLIPALGQDQVRQFEKSLITVNMRAAKAIPWILGFGYAYGAACHVLANGKEADREQAAITTALLMLILGLFDHLMDDFPGEFEPIEKLIDDNALKRWALGRDLTDLQCASDRPLAAGFLRLYRLYFDRCHRLLDRQPARALEHSWLQALCAAHAAERDSANRKISRVTPTQALIVDAEKPSTTAFQLVAITACLELDAVPTEVLSFANAVARLTWIIDDVVDLQADVKSDIWSGLALRLALNAKSEGDAMAIGQALASECAALMQQMQRQLGDARWQQDDSFSLMDILWAYMWVWAGGEQQDAGK